MSIREGLARLEGVESINSRADRKTATFEMRWKNGALLDPHTLSNHLHELGLGARLRGLEATVEGSLAKDGSHAVLRIRGTNSANASLRLAPLRTKVQQAVPKKQPVPATPAETRAYKTLLSKWKGEARPVRITGPLVRKRGQTVLELEVREFEFEGLER